VVDVSQGALESGWLPGDFLTVEVWTGRGLVTHCLLFVISFADRVVKIAGITTRPDESWMLQIARNATDSQAGALHSKRYLIIDRDTKYSEQFRRLIRDSGTKVIRLPPMSPNLNAYPERFVRSIKDECLNRMIFIGRHRYAAPWPNTWIITTQNATTRGLETD
jgi:putative transposase